MDHNRRGLALMVSALLISILVAAVRGCNDDSTRRFQTMDNANQRLRDRAAALTRPIKDYRITGISEGVMQVDAGDSITPGELKTLAAKLVSALYDADHVSLGSDLVFVEIQQHGSPACEAQTSARGIWVKLTGQPGHYVPGSM